MITSLRLFQRYIYHISKTISTLAQIVAVHPEQVLAQQVTMKQVYHTIPSDMPWTVSSGTRDFRSCCEKKCSEATHVQLDEEKIPPLHQLIGWYVESRNSFATCFVFPSCRWYHQISVPQYQLLTVCQQQWSRWSWKPWSEVVEKQAEYWWIWDTSAFKYRCKKNKEN